MEKKQRCDFCNVDVHRESYGKHIGNEKQLEKEQQYKMFLPERLFQGAVELQRRTYNPEPLIQKARKNNIINEKQLIKELADKINDPYHFTDRALKIGFIITLDSRHIKHASSEKNI